MLDPLFFKVYLSNTDFVTCKLCELGQYVSLCKVSGSVTVHKMGVIMMTSLGQDLRLPFGFPMQSSNRLKTFNLRIPIIRGSFS